MVFGIEVFSRNILCTRLHHKIEAIMIALVVLPQKEKPSIDVPLLLTHDDFHQVLIQ